jgi:hypothetical protein
MDILPGGSMAVRFQRTPNPNAGKFVTDRRVVEGKASRSWFSSAQAAGDPLGAALFAVPGVVSVFMVEDFVTVTKAPEVAWERLVPAVIAAIEGALP